ncbi:hypothetical protein Nepgr_028331 [Nepenthes gracilis]|uniref:Uncharacterized protein n=1 Tax=Nepenthes gracilis TaxID=150966 RepID=A0AAD3Y2B2_NEPGR|nr:hypothetical protein Nepgr_028331 [Nepenthes gracilis]
MLHRGRVPHAEIATNIKQKTRPLHFHMGTSNAPGSELGRASHCDSKRHGKATTDIARRSPPSYSHRRPRNQGQGRAIIVHGAPSLKPQPQHHTHKSVQSTSRQKSVIALSRASKNGSF